MRTHDAHVAQLTRRLHAHDDSAAGRAVLFLQRAQAHAAGDQTTHALRDVREALRLAPHSVPVLALAADAFCAAQLPEKALRVLAAADSHARTPAERATVETARVRAAVGARDARAAPGSRLRAPRADSARLRDGRPGTAPAARSDACVGTPDTGGPQARAARRRRASDRVESGSGARAMSVCTTPHDAAAGPSAPRPPASTPTLNLPPECMLRIFAALDFATRVRCTKVCHAWRTCIFAHAQLWREVSVGAPGNRAGGDAVQDRAGRDALCAGSAAQTPLPLATRLAHQTSLFHAFLSHARHQLSTLALGPPLANSDGSRAALAHAAALTTVSVSCAAEQAARWVAWAVQRPNLHALCVDATGDRLPTHPWLSPPVALPTVQCAPLHTLRLRGTPPLAADGATLHLCARLSALECVAGAAPGSLRAVRERCAAPLQRIIHAAHDTLETLLLDGDAVWLTDLFAGLPATPTRKFSCLAHLRAPLKALVGTAVPRAALFHTLAPRLDALEIQLAPTRAPGRTHDSLLDFARATSMSLRHLTLRVTSESATWLGLALLQIWSHIVSLELRHDEVVHTEFPPLETLATMLQQPLTGARLVRLLMQRDAVVCAGLSAADRPRGDTGVGVGSVALPHADVGAASLSGDPILCPRLCTLRFPHDSSLRGRELLELVLERHAGAPSRTHDPSAQPVEAGVGRTPFCSPLTHLDIDGCVELSPNAVPVLQRYVEHVHWLPFSVHRARLRRKG
ncbi:hypothetical protein MSPP1_000992 [Malassezia sp. CBS 17886]|nr:hypothetical protein MSPP1_000992 [Malassezia sp. CBS 17886]